MALYPEDPELLFRLGVAYRQRKDFAAAEKAWLATLRVTRHQEFSSVDAGLTGYRTRHNLAGLYADMERWDEAIEQWRLITESCPEYREAWRDWGDCLLRRNDRGALLALLNSGLGGHRPVKIWLNMQLMRSTHNHGLAQRLLEDGLREFPTDPELLEAYGRRCFELNDLRAAENPLKLLSQVAPNGAVHHNLATVYLHTGRREEAMNHCRMSLKLRPRWQETEELGERIAAAMRS